MQLEPIENDPVDVSERQAAAAQGAALVKTGFAVLAGAPLVMMLGAAGLFGVVPALGSPPIPYVLIGVGVLDLMAGAALVFFGKKKGAEA